MMYHILLEFDREHNLYFVLESDIPGLHVEASSVDEVMVIVRDVIPDLLGEAASTAKIDLHVEFPAAA